MEDLSGWAPRYNALPAHHLRLTLNTRRSVRPILVINLAEQIASVLSSAGFQKVAIVHVGRGSQTFEFSVEQDKANVEKTRAETANIRADTRLKNAKFAGMITALVLVAAGIGADIVEKKGKLGSAVAGLAREGAASICEIAVGDCSFELDLEVEPTQPSPPSSKPKDAWVDTIYGKDGVRRGLASNAAKNGAVTTKSTQVKPAVDSAGPSIDDNNSST